VTIVRERAGARFTTIAGVQTALVFALVASAAGDKRTLTAVDKPPARHWYVSPDGKPDNGGSIDRPLDLATALSPESAARPGDTIWLRGGVYSGAFTSELAGTAAAPIIVRQYAGERATIDGRGAAANTLTIRGAHTWFWGFEVTNSDPTRVYNRAVNLDPDKPDGVRGTGVNVFGPGIKCINLIVHDALGGFGLWESAINAEVYGSLAYHNGVVDTQRGHGHGLYIQNREGTKRIEDVIAFGNYATGMKAYGEGGYAVGVHFEGVVSFNNGVPSIGASPLDRIENLFVGTTDNPADRLTVVDSMFYHPPHTLGSNLTIGYQNEDNGGATLRNNLIIGGSTALSVRHWRHTTVTGNTMFATTSSNTNSDQTLVHLRQPASASAEWARNTYVDGTVQAMPFSFNDAQNRYGGGNLTFDDWRQSSGLDASSTYATGSPSGMVVRLRRNRYEPGRAHLVVYNWDRAESVLVDLSGIGLSSGDAFEVRDAQDFFGPPVLRTIYTGARVEVPLRGRQAAIANDAVPFPPAHTGPDFCVFVVLRTK
jgi:hypothetical protein